MLHANIGSALIDQGKYAAAEPEFARGLALLEKGMGPDSPDLVETLTGYATTLAGLDRADEAEVNFLRIKAITDARLAPAQPVALGGADGYAAFLLDRDRPGEALEQLRGSLGQLTARSAGGGRDWRTTVRGPGRCSSAGSRPAGGWRRSNRARRRSARSTGLQRPEAGAPAPSSKIHMIRRGSTA